MRKAWIGIALAAALSVAPPIAARPDSFATVVESAGREYLVAEAGVGLSIGVLHDGQSEFFDFGSVAKGGPAPTRDTAYEIGSIAKTISGLLLARAVIAGKLKLDDDVRDYLDGEYPNLVFEGEPVRLLHLANMTSALPDNLPDLSALEPDPGRHARAAALAAYTKAQFLKDLRSVSPSEKPGANVVHSNLAAQLLIYVLERAYGLDYQALLEREIERPLGFAARSSATGYDAEGRIAAALPRESFGNRYSVADMLRYAALQLDERDPAMRLSHEGSWFTLDRNNAIALSWIATYFPEGGRRYHYSGGTFGFASYMAIYPERKLAIVLLANKSGDTAQGRLGEIAARIADTLNAPGK